MTAKYEILIGDVLDRLRELPDGSVHCCVTSPPYWNLRDYKMPGQIGMEKSPLDFVDKLTIIFREVRRVLSDTGSLWLNLGDSYCNAKGTAKNPGGRVGPNACFHSPHKDASAIPLWRPNKSDAAKWGMKGKDLIGVPWMVAFSLRADGWYLRGDHIWGKPNGMPSSVEDRPTRSHEYVFLLTKSARYFYNSEAVRTAPKASTITRLAQDVESQAGSERANGGAKTNGTMKAVRRTDKQRGHSRTHAGFNDRWDAMKRDDQCADGASLRSIWWIPPAQCADAHFAVMPERVAEICIRAGCPEGGTVLDPFCGSGTTLLVARKLGRNSVGIELNPEYVELAHERIGAYAPLFTA